MILLDAFKQYYEDDPETLAKLLFNAIEQKNGDRLLGEVDMFAISGVFTFRQTPEGGEFWLAQNQQFYDWYNAIKRRTEQENDRLIDAVRKFFGSYRDGFERFIMNAAEDDGVSLLTNNAPTFRAILTAFNWSGTREGQAFWSNIDTQYRKWFKEEYAKDVI